jgi:hypothetical protein
MFRRLFHRGPAPGLHVCLCCGAPFVCPVEWHALVGGDVWILLRCGQCQTWREVTAPTPMADRFSADFELARSQIRAELRHLARQRLNDGR